MPNGFMEYGYDKFVFRVDQACLYSQDEFWVRDEGGGLFTVGATDFLQINAGDVAFLELPEVGLELKAGEEAGIMETIKTTVKILTPLSGKVKMINAALEDEPELVNSDAYGEGWIMKVEASGWEAERESLLTSAEYYPFMEQKIKALLKGS